MVDMKQRLGEAKLYLVLDASVCDYDKLFEILKLAADSGIGIIQLRDKNGSIEDICSFSKRALDYLRGRIPFIINDSVDIASRIGCDGVHLGQEDQSVKEARKILGQKAIIGASCQTLSHAKKAEVEGTDYIGFGSVFKTLTKPDRAEMDLSLLSDVLSEIKIPIFPIGGITLENIEKVIKLGANRVAVTRAVSLAEDVPGTIEKFLALL